MQPEWVIEEADWGLGLWPTQSFKTLSAASAEPQHPHKPGCPQLEWWPQARSWYPMPAHDNQHHPHLDIPRSLSNITSHAYLSLSSPACPGEPKRQMICLLLFRVGGRICCHLILQLRAVINKRKEINCLLHKGTDYSCIHLSGKYALRFTRCQAHPIGSLMIAKLQIYREHCWGEIVW